MEIPTTHRAVFIHYIGTDTRTTIIFHSNCLSFHWLFFSPSFLFFVWFSNLQSLSGHLVHVFGRWAFIVISHISEKGSALTQHLLQSSLPSFYVLFLYFPSFSFSLSFPILSYILTADSCNSAIFAYCLTMSLA